MKIAVGVDPGLSGAIVVTNGKDFIRYWPMPLFNLGKVKEVSFAKVLEIFQRIKKDYPGIHVFLERAIPFAMGSKGAFNYGRGFETLQIALKLATLPCTLVEPGKWTRIMHQGIQSDLKPKAKSLAALHRLYPQLVGKIPEKPKNIFEGVIDGLLIAGYGIRSFNPNGEDFF